MSFQFKSIICNLPPKKAPRKEGFIGELLKEEIISIFNNFFFQKTGMETSVETLKWINTDTDGYIQKYFRHVLHIQVK